MPEFIRDIVAMMPPVLREITLIVLFVYIVTALVDRIGEHRFGKPRATEFLLRRFFEGLRNELEIPGEVSRRQRIFGHALSSIVGHLLWPAVFLIVSGMMLVVVLSDRRDMFLVKMAALALWACGIVVARIIMINARKDWRNMVRLLRGAEQGPPA